MASGFELLFDLMAAFTFSQCDNLILVDPTWEGAVRGLLVLAALWGCWVTYCWAANIAHAGTGTLRTLHVLALVGLMLLGMTLPRAFSAPGLNDRVLVFLAAYLMVRLASAYALRLLHGSAATRRSFVVVLASLATVALIAASTFVRPAGRMPFWLAGLVCEGIATTAFVRNWTISAPAHFAERHSLVLIIGLDMGLGGMAVKMIGAPVGGEQLALIVMALLSAAVIWWLYFGTLNHYAEAQLARVRTRAEHTRLAYLHYNGLHLLVLTGLIAYAFGLRWIAAHMTMPHAGAAGPPLAPVAAWALTCGFAAYVLGITIMWSLFGRPPRPALLLAAATAVIATPFLIGRPALESLGVLVCMALALLAVEASRVTGRRPATCHRSTA